MEGGKTKDERWERMRRKENRIRLESRDERKGRQKDRRERERKAK